MREMVHNIMNETALIKEDTRPFLRDCYDHVIQLLDILETYRERASGLIDIYLSSVSARMNEVMKVLTIIATIFMPISFIASLYGMNFDTSSPYNLPELHWRYGYIYALTLMAIISVVMLFYFRARGWMDGGNGRERMEREKKGEIRPSSFPSESSGSGRSDRPG
jgi:magnesium transporter